MIKNITGPIKKIMHALPYIFLIAFGMLCLRWFQFANINSHKLVEPVVNGVIGGIVTSIIIFIFSVLWRSNITPWLENILYKDTKIEGIWNGVLVPFIGIDEIDKRRVKVAFGIIERRRKKRGECEGKNNESTSSKELSVSAKAQEQDGERDIEAELIIKGSSNLSSNDEQGELIDRKFVLKIASGMAPIEVKVEIKRIGHSIIGKIVEIGGASDIHTYKFTGSFKNLILTGEYENDDSAHIDRGGLSLMLRENGRSLEGFFSSYSDSDHHMAPFKCVLKRHARNNTCE